MRFLKNIRQGKPFRSRFRREPSEYVYVVATLAAVLLVLLSAV